MDSGNYSCGGANEIQGVKSNVVRLDVKGEQRSKFKLCANISAAGFSEPQKTPKPHGHGRGQSSASAGSGSAECVDDPSKANCGLVRTAGLCDHSFYGRNCCQTCREAREARRRLKRFRAA